MQPRDLLLSVPFFTEALNEAEIDILAANAVPVSFDNGAPVIMEQDLTDSLFVIASGDVSVSVRQRNIEKEVATLGPGDIIGEMSLMTGAPRAATVRARGPVTALEISKTAMKSLLKASPHLFDRFADTLHQRQLELDKLYGGSFWERLVPKRESMRDLMRHHLT